MSQERESHTQILDRPNDGRPTSDAAHSSQRPPIGSLLRSLRGNRTLREVEQGAGIPNSYLSNVEKGTKNPGLKTLSKLADFYGVSLEELLRVAGLPHSKGSAHAFSAIDVHRSFDFVMADPDVTQLQRPVESLSIEAQRFIVELYQHYTGKKLL